MGVGVIAILSFCDALTEAAYQGVNDRRLPPDLAKVVRRKLAYLDAAVSLSDLRAPPGNRLEALRGDRQGQHSIRVNDQYRLCFVWSSAGPKQVEFTDYH